MSLRGKKVLVIGGGSGIGFAVAQLALEAGAELVIASTRQERLEAAAARLGAGVTPARLDITREPEVQAFFETHTFDHVISTAGDWAANGGGFRTPLAEVDLSAAADSFRVRFWGALTVAKHAARVLPKDGSLTLTGGMISQRPAKGACIATSMAGAIEHMARGLAVELAPIRVNAVVPGLIRTGIWDRIPEEHREAQLAKMTAKLLVPRIGEADEAARAYMYLLECGYVTGQILYVEGGSR